MDTPHLKFTYKLLLNPLINENFRVRTFLEKFWFNPQMSSDIVPMSTRLTSGPESLTKVVHSDQADLLVRNSFEITTTSSDRKETNARSLSADNETLSMDDFHKELRALTVIFRRLALFNPHCLPI